VDTGVLTLQQAWKRAPDIIDAGDLTGAEKVLLYEADRILDRLSDGFIYPHILQENG